MTGQKEIERQLSIALKKMNLPTLVNTIKYFISKIELDPVVSSSYFGRGKARKDFKIFEKAIEDLSEAIQNNLKIGDYYRECGYSDVEDHYFKRALTDLNKAIQISPEDEDAYYYRGVAKCELGKSKEAIQDLTEAIKLNFDQSVVYFYRGQSYLDCGKYNEAVIDLNKYIKTESRASLNQHAYFLRGLAKSGASDYVGAIPDFTKTLNRDPSRIAHKVFLDYAKFKEKNKNEKFLDNYKLPEMNEKRDKNRVKKLIAKLDK
ncbi:MAG: hypothetical protein RDU14_02595 [Melioribacteraceae bacterium]|nr:hypothetical protein [Melioribacteraceae bacterium]